MMMSNKDIELEKLAWLREIGRHLEWQNAMYANIAYEIAQLQHIMMCAEGDSPETPEYESVMNRAAHFHDMWVRKYQKEVSYEPE